MSLIPRRFLAFAKVRCFANGCSCSVDLWRTASFRYRAYPSSEAKGTSLTQRNSIQNTKPIQSKPPLTRPSSRRKLGQNFFSQNTARGRRVVLAAIINKTTAIPFCRLSVLMSLILRRFLAYARVPCFANGRSCSVDLWRTALSFLYHAYPSSEV
ncbi:hypothetical protein CDAR_168941 [Caerostris darwini]|uniref:Uncharacterized protein n=1 Tax=Caerostris darwini TaxID=1538125 RepID=A0AAV4WP03_9ARAC|nr:hypothetical protein CDAR_168941 [Caerostris darwini]